MRHRQKHEVGLASLTSAATTTRSGASLTTDGLLGAGLMVRCRATIVTASVAATFTPQVSWDGGTTWSNVKLANNPTVVATAAGAGTHDLAVVIPKEVIGAPLFRMNAVLAGATTAAGDLTQVDYHWAPTKY